MPSIAAGFRLHGSATRSTIATADGWEQPPLRPAVPTPETAAGDFAGISDGLL
jgi:hypothetical protein